MVTVIFILSLLVLAIVVIGNIIGVTKHGKKWDKINPYQEPMDKVDNTSYNYKDSFYITNITHND